MQLYCDINLRKFVASPVDGKTIVSFQWIAGNVIPVVLKFVDTSTGAIINYGSHTLKISLGAYQAPTIPVLALAPNNLPVWNFNLSLKTSGIAAAINGLPSITAILQIFTNDGRYKTTWAQQAVTIINPVLPWVPNSSSSSSSSSTKASVSSSSSSTLASQSSSSSSTAVSHSSSSSTAASLSSSSSVLQSYFASGFGDPTYNGTYTFLNSGNGGTAGVTYTNGTRFLWNDLYDGLWVMGAVVSGPAAYDNGGNTAGPDEGDWNNDSSIDPAGTVTS